MVSHVPDNDEIADLLERIASLLEAQEASPYRYNAYRSAGRLTRGLDRPLSEIVGAEGIKGLRALPGVGSHIAALVADYIGTGRIPLLERLEGSMAPDRLFRSLPGIGPALAEHIHRDLGTESLEELERAAHDGRLETVHGFGARRACSVRAALAEVLGQSGQRRARAARRASGARPSLGALLAVDARYREGAEASTLSRIAPKRFNPEGHAWLPILHSSREGWEFTALFSNTARAHSLDRTHDWVVIHFERDGDEGQSTVVTEPRGSLQGRRVVRGRESECREHYRAHSSQAQLSRGAGI